MIFIFRTNILYYFRFCKSSDKNIKSSQIFNKIFTDIFSVPAPTESAKRKLFLIHFPSRIRSGNDNTGIAGRKQRLKSRILKSTETKHLATIGSNEAFRHALRFVKPDLCHAKDTKRLAVYRPAFYLRLSVQSHRRPINKPPDAGMQVQGNIWGIQILTIKQQTEAAG